MEEHLLRNRPRRRPQQHRRIQLRQLQKPQQHQNLRKQLRRQAQGLSPAIQETHLQKRKYINGVLTDSDEDSVTIEYGSDGDFNQTTFDISNADIQIGENKKQGGPLAASLNLKIGYYVENGDYIAVSVYGDGSESMTPSWVDNYEMKSVSGNVRYNDDSTMTIETGSDGDFYEMTFDISSAELDIQVDEVIGVSGLRTSLNVDVNYYVKDGVNIATYVYSDGTEYFSPSQLYNMEQRNTQAEEDTQEYEESGDGDYIDEEEETSEDY